MLLIILLDDDGRIDEFPFDFVVQIYASGA